MLETFEQTYKPAGFSSLALCPAYGLAECTLAVTMTPPNTQWTKGPRSNNQPESGLGVGFATSGPPLAGVEIRIAGEEPIGEIQVRAPFGAERYSNGDAVRDREGWLATGDAGYLARGELVVVGRLDDMFQIGGRNVHAVEIASWIEEHGGVRRGRVYVTRSDRHRVTIVAERKRIRGGSSTSQMKSEISGINLISTWFVARSDHCPQGVDAGHHERQAKTRHQCVAT